MSENTFFSGRFYRNGNFEELLIEIQDGIIADISKFRKGVSSTRIEDAVLPGFMDIHVHFRDPGETEKEDFTTGSMSAVYGGTTTVFDMPNNRIPITDYNRYDEKKAAIKGRSYADYGLYSMYTGKNSSVISGESSALKIYMGGSTNSSGADIDYEHDTFLGENPRLVVLHGEMEDCLITNSSFPAMTLKDHDMLRNSRCEAEAVTNIMKMKTKNIVMAHVSNWENIPEGKINFHTEMTPHHMLLNTGMNLGAWAKVNPPIRDRDTMEKNRQAYLDGKVDILSSDHAPHTEYEKESVEHGKSGIIGVETRIPLMLALVQKKILPLETLVQTGAIGPAERMGIKKGKIEVGYAADFCSVRLSSMKRINQERLHSKNPFSPFDGFDAVFPSNVYVGGIEVISSGELVESRSGKYIPFKEGKNV